MDLKLAEPRRLGRVVSGLSWGVVSIFLFVIGFKFKSWAVWALLLYGSISVLPFLRDHAELSRFSQVLVESVLRAQHRLVVVSDVQVLFVVIVGLFPDLILNGHDWHMSGPQVWTVAHEFRVD